MVDAAAKALATADLTALVSSTGVIDLTKQFGATLVPIKELNCATLNLDKTYDYYKDMIDYKTGFLQANE